jgi:ribonucleoside-diphosphate reductase alpha chain
MSSADIYVLKAGGHKELWNPDKIHEKVMMACDGITGVSASLIEMNANLHIRNNIKSSDIQKTLINASSELISEENPNYEYVTARLLNQQIRKEVYGQYQPHDFLEEIKKRCNKGIYDKDIFNYYSEEEIQYFGKKIRYQKDDNFTYTGLKQLYSKYLVKRKGKIVETPQEIFMLMPMYVFRNYNPEMRKKWVIEGYKCLSDFEVSLPTPIMNGLRTAFKRFISCNLINAGDTSKSLAMANAFIMMMTANKSGIGVNDGYIRGLGADIDNGRMEHTGILPILKAQESATKAFTQESRGGSSTNYYPFFHYEAELIMQLGNAKGTADTRVRHADHTIVFNKLFFERIANGQDITLFHINSAPKLYDNIGYNETFKELYEHYERTVPAKHKKTIKASAYKDLFHNERFLQGRLYYMFADNANQHGMWKIHVNQSNLCLEIIVPATPLDSETPEVGVCILAGLQHGYLTDERVPVASEFLVRFLEEMIDYMDYTHPEIEYAAKKRRTLGIGHSDIFHYLAKNKMFYNTLEGRNLMHKRYELATYWMTRTSVEIAKEKGPCELYKDTKYSDGMVTLDVYKRTVDELVTEPLHCDWDGLRADLKKFGIRHSTLTSNPPFGNSAKTGNATSGAEPPRFLATVKDDKKVKLTQLVPEYNKLKNYYTTAWGEDFNNIDYFKFIAVLQKFIDQSVSTNQYTNLLRYEGGKVPMSVLEEEFITAYYYGLKTMYYQNFRSDDGVDGIDDEKATGCGSGGCVV